MQILKNSGMIQIFYRHNGLVEVGESLSILQEIRRDELLWIDLLSPSGEEKKAVETYLDTTLQSRAQAEEIESSSRFSETDDVLFANTNFMIPSAENYTIEPVSFIVTDEGSLVSIRNVPLRSFTDIQRRLSVTAKSMTSGLHVLVSVLENRIDMDADMIELMSKEIAQYSKRVSLGEDVSEEFLLDINQMQENTMLVRENVVDKQRMLSSMLKSDKFPPETIGKFEVLLKDVSSLINHTNFDFERLEYLQNTVLGLINLEQNKIMKIFTFVSLLLMPATLVASFYGMNVHLPLEGWQWSWLAILGVMVMVIVAVFLVFKKRRML